MARKGFSMEFDAETTACARGKDIPCSPKMSRNIVRTIKGMRVTEAKDFLEQVMEQKVAVPMRVRNRKIKHRRGRMGPGAFPVKAADRVLGVLTNAENNAEYKGLDPDDLRIVHASAYVGQRFQRWKPRAHGRATAHNEQTTNMEIVLGERPDLDEAEEAKAERRSKGAKKPAKKAKKAPAKAEKAAEKPAEKTEAAPEEKSEEAPAEAGNGPKGPVSRDEPKAGEANKATEEKKEEA